jgi:polysaccharide transporter, PST family
LRELKKLFKNIVALGIIQITNLLIPLLIAPHLIHTLGFEVYGIISSAQSLCAFFLIFVDFGFNILSVRQLSQSKSQKSIISKIVNNVFFSKIYLLTIGFILYLTIVISVPIFRINIELFLLSYFIVAGQALSPIWFYQGMEKIDRMIVIQLAVKIISIAILVKSINTIYDGKYVNLYLGLGNLIAGLLLYGKLLRDEKISLRLISLKDFYKQIHLGYLLFFSNISVSVYINSPILLLGIFSNQTIVGVFSLVEKIIQLMRMILGFTTQIFYPKVCALAETNFQKLIYFEKLFYIPFWVTMLLICVLISYNPVFLISYLTKSPSMIVLTSHTLAIYIYVPFIVALNLPFYQNLLAMHYDKLCSKILIIGAFISLSLNILLIEKYKLQGVIYTSYCTELFVTISLAFFSIQKIKFNGTKRLY